jgi:hypothetical protein
MTSDIYAGTFTADQFAALPRPPCPVCGDTIHIDRIDVTLNEHDLIAYGRRYIVGRSSCPRGCDPTTGQRFHGYQEQGYGPAGGYFRCSCGVDRSNLTDLERTGLVTLHPLGRFS